MSMGIGLRASEKPMFISQSKLVTGILNLLAEQLGPDAAILPRQFNVIVSAADSIVAEMERPYREAKPGCGYREWCESDDTGLSSKYLADILWSAAKIMDDKAEDSVEVMKEFCKKLHGRGDKFHYPRDSGDFGRCVKMLDSDIRLRENLHWMSQAPSPWPSLIAKWDVLEQLYRAGELRKLTEEIVGCTTTYGEKNEDTKVV